MTNPSYVEQKILREPSTIAIFFFFVLYTRGHILNCVFGHFPNTSSTVLDGFHTQHTVVHRLNTVLIT